MGSWATWFLDFNKHDVWNKCGGAKFGPFLINVVAEITELWVENSQKINCCDVTSIPEGRAILLRSVYKHLKGIFAYLMPTTEGQQSISSFFLEQSCLKKEEIHCTNNYRKTAGNEWDNDDSVFLQPLYCVYKK